MLAIYFGHGVYSVVFISSEILVGKSNIFFASGSWLETASWLGMGVLSTMSFSSWDLGRLQLAQSLCILWVHVHTIPVVFLVASLPCDSYLLSAWCSILLPETIIFEHWYSSWLSHRLWRKYAFIFNWFALLLSFIKPYLLWIQNWLSYFERYYLSESWPRIKIQRWGHSWCKVSG